MIITNNFSKKLKEYKEHNYNLELSSLKLEIVVSYEDGDMPTLHYWIIENINEINNINKITDFFINIEQEVKEKTNKRKEDEEYNLYLRLKEKYEMDDCK